MTPRHTPVARPVPSLTVGALRVLKVHDRRKLRNRLRRLGATVLESSTRPCLSSVESDFSRFTERINRYVYPSCINQYAEELSTEQDLHEPHPHRCTATSKTP